MTSNFKLSKRSEDNLKGVKPQLPGIQGSGHSVVPVVVVLILIT
jgi:hypothetical protein